MTDPNQPPPYPPSSPPPAYNANPPAYPSSGTSAGAYPPPAYPPPAYPQPSTGAAAPGPATTAPGRTMGIVALIGSILLSGLSIVWLILGIVALVKSRRAGAKNGFALAAIIISSIVLVVSIVLLVVFVPLAVQFAQLCGEYGSGTYEVNGVPVDISCG